MRENNLTEAWRLYETGQNYNSRLTPSYYRLVESNTEFFIGNQWLNLSDTPAMRSTPKPTFNIIKRVASLFVASLSSSGVAVRFEPLAYYGGGVIDNPDLDASKFINAEIENLLEKFKFEYRIRDALFDGAQTGDYCAHFWFDPEARPYGGALGEHLGEIRMELVDGVNVMFGNPNDRRTESQPYILLIGRDSVENLRSEARRFQSPDAEAVEPDSETQDFPGNGGQTELEPDDRTGKALYVLLYTKRERESKTVGPDGRSVTRRETTVHVTKATRNAVIYEDIDTGLSVYPVAWGNWEKQKNQYHGRALVTGIIPNQIFINTMFATAMRHQQLMAFPKTIYNKDLIQTWTNEVGQAIGIRGLQPGQSVGQAASQLQASEMSAQIFALIDKAMSYTKDCLGATDAQLGNVKPDNTSALMVLQTNAEVPLENIRAGLHEWVEDIGRILLDMIGTYYGRRPVFLEEEFPDVVRDGMGNVARGPDGLMMVETVRRTVAREFDFSIFKHLWMNLRVDVGAASVFSEMSMVKTLDNLRADGALTWVEYLERIPNRYIPKKEELIQSLKEREQANRIASGGERGGALSGDMEARGSPMSLQASEESLPKAARRIIQQQGANRMRL